ncbi:MAG: prepilin-type N-terminal cleavage/methylation domain-containing protein [Bacteroidales bacterium]|nr:prepilin-type N-terminal cleavage/methylation domain-containing protein [Bacteroidales bacterium]
MKILNGSNPSAIGEKGFTLIEVMIAMGVFAIGILAVASMQITASQGNRSARLQTEAVTRASECMENLVNQGYSDITDGSDTQGEINLSWTVADDTPITDIRTVTVTATWNDRGGTRNADFSYIIFDSED